MTLQRDRERWLMLATPLVAMAAVGIGLHLGGGEAKTFAEVSAAPASAASAGVAWQILALREEHGIREPVAHLGLDVLARTGGGSTQWRGETNEDGVAEALLLLPSAEETWLRVSTGETLLAEGLCASPPGERPRTPVLDGWARFARRDGPIALNLAVLGHRAAPSFATDLWVRATDASTELPVRGAELELQSDPSFAPGTARPGKTDSRGWGHITVVPVGLAVTATLKARSPDGREGTWVGGLYMSPGAPAIGTRDRWDDRQSPEFDITMPGAQRDAYFEIDDAHGRAWAAVLSLSPGADGRSTAHARAPALASGLYWAVASGSPEGAVDLAAGTIARPFFVASTDEGALAAGTDRQVCSPPLDVHEMRSALSSCLALAAMTPASRWVALDGLEGVHAVEQASRSKGMAVAIGAILIAMLLEAVLLWRAGARTRTHLIGDAAAKRPVPGDAMLALLVALLGLALLAAFIVRTG